MNLTARQRLLYSSGVVNYALKDASFGAFVLFYYKQVLGLSGTLTGMAIALSVIWDAVSDPLVGAWSDRLRGRWGRRHPLMLASVAPLALSFIALFSPPDMALQSQGHLFAWLLVSVILLRTALTLFMVPFLALRAEITDDYHERTRLAGMRRTWGWFLGYRAGGCSVPVIRRAGRSRRPFRHRPLPRVRVYQCPRGSRIQRRLHRWHVAVHSQACPDGSGSYAQPGEGYSRDLDNRNFRYVMILETAVGGMSGIVSTLLMVTYTYFWLLDPVQISVLFAGPIFLAVIAVTLASPVLNRALEKQQLLRVSCLLGCLNLLWLTPLKLFGLLPQNDTIVFWLIFLNYAIFVAMTILRTIANHSLLADVADEYDLDTGQRQEGIMFAAAFFAAKFISGFGYLVAGPLLDLIGLEAGAEPGATPPSVDWGLGLIMGPGLALVMIIPVWVAFRIQLSRASYQAVQQALRKRGETATD
ncbi:MAG: MFS transporter [Halioglobus sp.]|nr:MFS transporter [Halioglobus sp.]